MKSDSISIRTRTHHRKAGFSLVEMIGVLAIIAILAVVIVPKVFSTIASSRVTNAIGSVNTMRTAVTDFAGKYGTLPTTNNKSRFDDLLVAAGILDTRFTPKIGTQPTSKTVNGAKWTRSGDTWTNSGGSTQNTQSRIACQVTNTRTPSTAAGRNFYLDGNNDLPAGSRVVSAVLVGVSGSEAHELSQRLDGGAFTQATAATADNQGKVVYNKPNGQGQTTVYVYVAHQ